MVIHRVRSALYGKRVKIGWLQALLPVYSPSRVVDSLYELIQLCALCIAEWAWLLVAACVVNVHLVGHGVACRAFWVGGEVLC